MNKEKIIQFFRQIIDEYDFELIVDTNKNVFRLNDLQDGNLGNIEQEEFLTLADILDRLEIYHQDYIYRALENREDAGEIISKNDWDFVVKRYIESDLVQKALAKINTKEYEEIIDISITPKDIMEILDEEDKLYKNICQKYVDTMSKEMLLEKDNKILHIFIEDEYIELKENGKITIDNYQDYLDGDFEIYEYDCYKEFFDGTVKDEIVHDLNDLGLFDENGKWDFYITFEELKAIGYGFMVKDNYPLIEEYAVPKEKIFEFFDYFSLEQLGDFENSLDLYFNSRDIVYNQDSDTLESKEGYNFNRDILRLACGLITYDDFISFEKYEETKDSEIEIELN